MNDIFTKKLIAMHNAPESAEAKKFAELVKEAMTGDDPIDTAMLIQALFNHDASTLFFALTGSFLEDAMKEALGIDDSGDPIDIVDLPPILVVEQEAVAHQADDEDCYVEVECKKTLMTDSAVEAVQLAADLIREPDADGRAIAVSVYTCLDEPNKAQQIAELYTDKEAKIGYVYDPVFYGAFAFALSNDGFELAFDVIDDDDDSEDFDCDGMCECGECLGCCGMDEAEDSDADGETEE